MIHTVSSIRDWRTCRRLWRYRHLDLVRPVASGKALNVGRAVHRGLELLATGTTLSETLAVVTLETNDVDSVELARVRAMLRGYHAAWAHTFDAWQTVSVEEEFKFRLSQSEVAGKKDAVKRHVTAGLHLWEYKTSSDDIADVACDFWQRLAIDAQVSLYQWRTEGDPAIMYDVLRKPQGGPKSKEAIRRRKIETDEEFNARKEAARETIEEFEERLVSDMAADQPKYFVRRVIHRTREQSQEIINELLEDVQVIEAYRGLYPRNDSACRGKFGTCIYLGVCGGTESLDSERFRRLETSHPELSNGDNYDDCPL